MWLNRSAMMDPKFFHLKGPQQKMVVRDSVYPRLFTLASIKLVLRFLAIVI